MTTAPSSTGADDALRSGPAPGPAAGPAAGPDAGSGRFTPRARLILLVLCAAQFFISLDFSILNVALPVLGRDLGMGPADLQWAVTAFALPSGGFLLLFGRIADLYGRRRLFLTGVAVFTVASVLAALAWSPGLFLGARALQGLGAAAVVPTGMSLLTTIFPEGPRRNRALGINGTLLSLGYTTGMLLGGGMTEALGWRSTMALLALAGTAVLVGAGFLLPESRTPERPRLDLPGALAVTGGLLSVIYALSTAAEQGFGRPDVVAAVTAGAALLTAFVVIESRAAQPLVSLGMLRRPTVAFGNLGGVITFSMMSSVIFLLTLYLQVVLGLSALQTSLVFGAQGVVLALTGAVSSRVIGRIGARATLTGGLAVQGACTTALVLVGAEQGAWLALTALCLASAGHMSAVVSYGVNATSGLPDHEQGLATGLITSSQQLGITIGIPVLGALSASRVHALRETGTAADLALLSGVRLAFAVDAAVVLAASLLIGYGLFRRRRSADRS
ncbi:MFS transporter [Streptomyces sp. S07_1.15]|uniref:MFS transporter n=1 Tax=Streptomyces sp. S07_1.15 TaxID=2873925 RepID=UPI001D15873B|nr:MFS transporter [Streptomyces sp. S07_1.15]MCC3655286.1 MFS transporter [Streptomyces sp. S07_1.15]